MKRRIIPFFFVLLSCSPYEKYYEYDYDVVKLDKIKTVVITPLCMIRQRPIGTDLRKISMFEKEIANYVKKAGYTVLPSNLLVENWQNESGKLDGFFDPATGKIDGSQIAGCLMKAIAASRAKTDFDAVIFAQLASRPAQLAGDRIYWDGCSRQIYDTHGDVVTNAIWRGEMAGLSLQIQVFDRNHNLAFQSFGAIEYPYVLSKSYQGDQFVWKDTLGFHEDDIMEGISIAFHPFIYSDKYPQKPQFYGK